MLCGTAADGGYAFPFPFIVAFGFNSHIAMSMNYLHTAKGGGCFAPDFILDFDGIARNFIARYISTAPYKHALTRTCSTPPPTRTRGDASPKRLTAWVTTTRSWI